MEVWEFIAEKLRSGIPVILLYVLESNGSSPGRQGFKMAVSNGELCGSIGGGIMEYKLVETAKAGLAGVTDPVLIKQVHNKLAVKDQSGMICSGEQTILLYNVQLEDLQFVDELISNLKRKENGTLQLTENGINFCNEIPEHDYYFHRIEDKFLYKERTGLKNILHIIGGGHCSLALSKILSGIGFHITVYDERDDLNTMVTNVFADKKIIIPSYSSLNSFIKSDKEAYVVVMTFGYRTDDIVIRSLLNKEFKYFGVLGSRSKIDKMFTEYREENITESLLKKIHAPVGIQINSQTPDEIAISIAAEIISIKNAIAN